MTSRFVRPRSSMHTAAGSLVQPIVFSTNQKFACLPNTKYNWLYTKYNSDGCYVTAVRWKITKRKTETRTYVSSRAEKQYFQQSVLHFCVCSFVVVFLWAIILAWLYPVLTKAGVNIWSPAKRKRTAPTGKIYRCYWTSVRSVLGKYCSSSFSCSVYKIAKKMNETNISQYGPNKLVQRGFCYIGSGLHRVFYSLSLPSSPASVDGSGKQNSYWNSNMTK